MISSFILLQDLGGCISFIKVLLPSNSRTVVFCYFQSHIKKYLNFDIAIIIQDVFVSLIVLNDLNRKFKNDPRYSRLLNREIYDYNKY